VSDKKYRQHGYQDRDQRSESKPQQSSRPSGDMAYGPRAIQMAPTHTISRCAQCGVVLPATVDPNGKCPQCGAALHACKQCMHFDPGMEEGGEPHLRLDRRTDILNQGIEITKQKSPPQSKQQFNHCHDQDPQHLPIV